MGQYHLTVNLDKREFLDPHKLGDGLKLWEQVDSHGGVMAALMALLACSNGWGGGDLEEHPMIGRWAGDRIAVVGDYAARGDLPPEHNAGLFYDLCRMGQKPEEGREMVEHYLRLAKEARKKGHPEVAEQYEESARRLETLPPFRDISDDIRPVVEAVCRVRITGTGWREKKERGA